MHSLWTHIKAKICGTYPVLWVGGWWWLAMESIYWFYQNESYICTRGIVIHKSMKKSQNTLHIWVTAGSPLTPCMGMCICGHVPVRVFAWSCVRVFAWSRVRVFALVTCAHICFGHVYAYLLGHVCACACVCIPSIEAWHPDFIL